MIARVVARTDGNPLFVEEMTRMLVGSTGGSDRRTLPDTLTDLLTERLDQLGPAKLLLQVGSVIGRISSLAWLRRCSARRTRSSRQGLVRSWRRHSSTCSRRACCGSSTLGAGCGLPVDLGQEPPDPTGQVAASLEADFPDLCQREPELLARHLTEAGKPLAAARWWLLGGRQAIGRGSAREAAALLQAGLDALAGRDVTPERLGAELDLLAVLGPAQMVLNGPGSPTFGMVQRRAYVTGQALPDHPAIFPISYGLALYHWGKAEFVQALELAEVLAATAAGILPPST